jgi:retron-type reverse transcriptase
MKIYRKIFEQIISPENLFAAWDIFKSDKRKKPDVMKFESNIEKHLFRLYRELRNGKYRHGPYSGFYITDPKVRHIHKAVVRDRVLHHALFRVLYPIFDPTFIAASFSCRIGKGTHRGVKYLATAIRAVSKNYTKPCFVLKCDIRKFFDSIDHGILLEIIARRVRDGRTLILLGEIVESYSAGSAFTRERERERVKTLRVRECLSAI